MYRLHLCRYQAKANVANIIKFRSSNGVCACVNTSMEARDAFLPVTTKFRLEAFFCRGWAQDTAPFSTLGNIMITTPLDLRGWMATCCPTDLGVWRDGQRVNLAVGVLTLRK